MNKKGKKSNVEKAKTKPSTSYDCCWYDLCCSPYPFLLASDDFNGLKQPLLEQRQGKNLNIFYIWPHRRF
jgi:hypothetical protein